MHPIRFVIWFNQRSGSTHLSSLLDSHPQVTCWREIFYRGEASSADDYFTRSGLKEVHTFLDCFFTYRWGSGGTQMAAQNNRCMPSAIGFKLKYQQIRTYPDIECYLLHNPQIKVIHLIRKNLLATVISSQLVPQLLALYNRSNILSETKLDNLSPSVELNPSTILDELTNLEADIKQARNVVAHMPVLEVAYEDLLNAAAATSRSILKFIGVEIDYPLSSKYRKIMPQSVQESIGNLQQIRQVLKGTRFESFLG